MASNDLTVFDPKVGLPAHIAGFFDEESNILARQTVPSLSPEGKIWTIALNGEKTKLIRKNADGDEEPVSVMRVVVLDYAKRRGRAYYEGEYDPTKIGAPVCWSDDGITPDNKSEKLQATKCEDCPMAVKGSKVTPQGKAVSACSQHRMLAVVPAFNLDFEPLRLKIAITSDFDKQSPEAEAQGWFAFSNFTDYLQTRGVQHTAALVTKMKFDANAPYPKIFFAADRWLTEAELTKVIPMTKADNVQKLLGGTWTPAGVDGVKKDETTAAPAGDVPAGTKQQAAAEPDDDDGDGEIVMQGMDAPAAEPVQESAQATKPAPKAPKKAEPAAAAAVAATATEEVSTKVPNDVADLLKDWGAD